MHKSKAAARRSIQLCDFKSAGKLSNENARALTSLMETFGRHLADELGNSLGTALGVTLKSLDQVPVKEHVASNPVLSFMVPLTMNASQATLIADLDVNLVFPMIEVLLGGIGTPLTEPRELSEIEEEIMQGMAVMLARQAEQSWGLDFMSLVPGRRIKSSSLSQYCAVHEKLTIATFEIEIAGASERLRLLCPGTFLNVLLDRIKLDGPQKLGNVRKFPQATIRERIVDCDFEAALCLSDMKMAVRDLISLRPGALLKLRAPIRTPGRLTIEGADVAEATPVRSGSQKAAQIGRLVNRMSPGGV